MFNTTSLNLDLNKIMFRAYSDDYRKYHNVRHVQDIIDVIERGTKERYSDSIYALKIAAYFHDVIYIPGNKDNEELSEKFFRENFANNEWNDDIICDQISDIILATKDHFSEENDGASYLTKLFLDCDIWDFGSPYEDVVVQNFWKLREEYMRYHYPNGKYPSSAVLKYKEGTINFIENIHNKKDIFRVHKERNEQAHKNVEHLLKYLDNMPL